MLAKDEVCPDLRNIKCTQADTTGTKQRLTSVFENRVTQILRCLYVDWKTEVVHTAFAERIFRIFDSEIYKFRFNSKFLLQKFRGAS